MLAHWEQMLVALELLNPQIPSETLTRLRAMFARTQLTNNEVNFLRGIARAVLRVPMLRYLIHRRLTIAVKIQL